MNNLKSFDNFGANPSEKAKEVTKKLAALAYQVSESEDETVADKFRKEAFDLMLEKMPTFDYYDFRFIYNATYKLGERLHNVRINFYNTQFYKNFRELLLLEAAKKKNYDLLKDACKGFFAEKKQKQDPRQRMDRGYRHYTFDKTILYRMLMENNLNEAAQILLDNKLSPATNVIRKYGYPKTHNTEDLNWQVQPTYKKLLNRFGLKYESTPRQEKNGTLELHNAAAHKKFIISRMGDIRKGTLPISRAEWEREYDHIYGGGYTDYLRFRAGNRVDLVKRTGLAADIQGNQEKLLQELYEYLVKKEKELLYSSIKKNKDILKKYKIELPNISDTTIDTIKSFWHQVTTEYPNLAQKVESVPKEWMNKNVQNLINLGFYDLI
jgi:hypothetical protein